MTFDWLVDSIRAAGGRRQGGWWTASGRLVAGVKADGGQHPGGWWPAQDRPLH